MATKVNQLEKKMPETVRTKPIYIFIMFKAAISHVIEFKPSNYKL